MKNENIKTTINAGYILLILLE